ncbi:MAG: multicopper oxidase family protein, partial [Mesorhizobium sp.]
AQIAPEPHGNTPIWCYDGRLPGPEIRIRQGERLRVAVENKLNEETTVHWHGVRVPNVMDGVPHLTQAPIAPGETFAYEFDAIDAGTFWYHPHHRSFEQVGRGLYGPLIVEEADPVRVDREVTWVLSDWRLTKTAEMREDFGNRHDMMHSGRVGNTVTINGRVPDVFQVRK